MTTATQALRFLANHVRAHPRAYAILSTYVLSWLLSGYAWATGRVLAAWIGGALVGFLTAAYVLGALYVHTNVLTPEDRSDEPEQADGASNRSTEEVTP